MMQKVNYVAASCEAHAFRASNIITEMHATLGHFQTTLKSVAGLISCFCNGSFYIIEA